MQESENTVFLMISHKQIYDREDGDEAARKLGEQLIVDARIKKHHDEYGAENYCAAEVFF